MWREGNLVEFKEYRKKKGWTQAELAEKLDVSIRTVQSWEQKIRFPDRRSKKAIAKLLEFEKIKDELVEILNNPS